MKNKVKFELQMIDVSYLVELVPKIPKEVKDQLQKNASPTIEEYEVLLDIPLSNRLRVYLFTGTQDANEDIIKELIASTTLAIYGKTLFPFVNDMVDQGAIDVLHKFRKFGVNPVPAILSDTLLAFQKSHEKSIPKIRCCVQLLYVWMMTMFKHHQYPDWSQNPLRRFRNTFVKPMMLSEWEKLFREVTPKNFGTKCNIYDKHDMIMYSCGDYSNMVLMGPRGCLTFTPALVLGQMKWGMTPVREEQLQGFVIWYKDREATNKTLDAVRAKLEETRDQKEKHELTIEKLYKIIDAQKKEEISLKRDYANMCSTSEKSKSSLAYGAMDIQVLEVKAEKLQAISQDAKNEENHAWATMKEYQAALDKTLERENQLKAIMEEMEKAHHQALAEANDDKVYLSEQLTLLEATHKELVTRQQEWSHNWDNMLQECKWDKDRWEERCRKIIDGFGDFADGWLRTFEEARGELHMYPETELRPAMKTFYETCDGLAWKLRKWRIAATGDF
ncbi:hypothetical protein Lal_00023545 [Lupinus albus]|nr:hypothetical protein Lal_00023545 [Lupinus albus]